jgi:7-cyano-7-deazaguanine synthase in queuosine biosynthesis
VVNDCNPQASGSTEALRLCWQGKARNALCDLSPILGGADVPDAARDLLDIAAAIYLADVAAPRGRNEAWVRDIALEVPVREPGTWEPLAPDLCRLLHVLTRDNFAVHFPSRDDRAAQTGELRTLDAPVSLVAPAPSALGADCISLLSGGLDSLAGAVMLLHTGRSPRFVLHRGGNPVAESAQKHVLGIVQRLCGEAPAHAAVRVMPHSLPAEPAIREPSRRARSLLFMSLAAVTALTSGVSDIYMCENGFFSFGLPLTAARAGSLSTRSTHPVALHLFGELCGKLGLAGRVQNPFLYQTKTELIRDILRPALPPRDIQRTVSCWAAGRTHRQCGGCVPCIIRRIAMLAAGLHDEAYEIDILGEPERHRGTDAYVNLVDVLTQAAGILTKTDIELLLTHPQLLDLQAASVNVEDALAVLRRHAVDVMQVVEAHFPASAALLSAIAEEGTA